MSLSQCPLLSPLLPSRHKGHPYLLASPPPAPGTQGLPLSSPLELGPFPYVLPPYSDMFDPRRVSWHPDGGEDGVPLAAEQGAG